MSVLELDQLVIEVDGEGLAVGGTVERLEIGFFSPAGSLGEPNTAANVGAGAGVFRDKVGFVLNLRSLVGVGGITATVVGDTIEIDGNASGQWAEDEFTPTQGQSIFPLGRAPVDVVSLGFYVNGHLQDDGVDYTLAGSTITWLNVFVVGPLDKIIAKYK